MHIALVHDVERLRHEHRLLARLAIALVADGAALTRIIPAGFDVGGAHEGERRISLIRRLEYPTGGWSARWSVRQRAEKIADALEKAPPDIVHVIGTEAWRLGLCLGEELERPVALDVWSVDQVSRANRLMAHPATGAVLTATTALTERLAHGPHADRVLQCAWGVAGREDRPRRSADRESPTLAVVGSCRDLAAYEALLGGVRRALESMRELRVVLELRDRGGHDVWRAVRRLGLLGQVSCITASASIDSLLLECDALLLPEATGAVRGLVLEAMERAVPVIARLDPMVDLLADDTNVIPVDPPSPEEWARRIHRLYAHADEAHGVARTARRTILGRFRSSDWSGRLVENYERLAGQPALSFSDQPS